jgi:hypothetical protein
VKGGKENYDNDFIGLVPLNVKASSKMLSMWNNNYSVDKMISILDFEKYTKKSKEFEDIQEERLPSVYLSGDYEYLRQTIKIEKISQNQKESMIHPHDSKCDCGHTVAEKIIKLSEQPVYSNNCIADKVFECPMGVCNYSYYHGFQA